MSNLHPIFDDILKAHGAPREQPTPLMENMPRVQRGDLVKIEVAKVRLHTEECRLRDLKDVRSGKITLDDAIWITESNIAMLKEIAGK